MKEALDQALEEFADEIDLPGFALDADDSATLYFDDIPVHVSFHSNPPMVAFRTTVAKLPTDADERYLRAILRLNGEQAAGGWLGIDTEAETRDPVLILCSSQSTAHIRKADLEDSFERFVSLVEATQKNLGVLQQTQTDFKGSDNFVSGEAAWLRV